MQAAFPWRSWHLTLGAAALALAVAAAPSARAATIVSSLPEFTSAGARGQSSTMGTFTFAVPAGDTILSAAFDSTFGNSLGRTSAGVDLFLDGILFAQCVAADACTAAPGPDTVSTSLSNAVLTQLADGAATLTAVQTGPGTVRLGISTLTIQTAATAATPIPEPASLALLGVGLLGLGLGRRPRA